MSSWSFRTTLRSRALWFGATWLYVAALALVALLMQQAGDRWWLGTLLLYGPRWVWAVPLAGIAPLALRDARVRWPALLAVVVLFGAILPCSITWGGIRSTEIAPGTIRVLSCNVEGRNLNAPALRALIEDLKPDVVALQEWSPRWKTVLFPDPGWFIQQIPGQCLASRFPIGQVEELGWRELHGPGAVLICPLESPSGPLPLVTLHLATPRDGLEAMLHSGLDGCAVLDANTSLRWHESEVVARRLAGLGNTALIAGDFNVPGESPLFRTHWRGWTDAFREAGLGFGHTKFTRWHGTRIDHILHGAAWRCRHCWVGPNVGSDHRPVLADLEQAE
jgi:vancomycin resistance protein VanJ